MIRLVTALALVCLSAMAQAAPPLAVEVVTVVSEPTIRQLSLTGTLVARNPVQISFAVGGRLAAVAVDVGDTVKAGDVLVQLDSVQQEQALRGAQAALSSAQAQYDQANGDFLRQDGLLKSGATTRIARDNAEDALMIASGGLAQAEAGLALAQKSLEDTVLKASAAGTVIERLGEQGEVVGAAQPVLELALGDKLDAIFDVPEALLIEPIASQEVALSLLDHPDQSFTGQVREISPLVDPNRGTVQVTVSVVDPPATAGFGDAILGSVSATETSQVTLPFSAIAITKDSPAVWVADPASKAVSLRPVRIERFDTGHVIVAEGLAAGEIVVTRGSHLLFPGRLVRYEVSPK
jgi:membrane fusion protein, multidrug efflux system